MGDAESHAATQPVQQLRKALAQAQAEVRALRRQLAQAPGQPQTTTREAEARAETVRIQHEITALDLDLPAAMALAAGRARALTDADGAVIELAEGDALVCRAADGTTGRVLGSRLSIAASLSGHAVRTSTVQLCDDARSDPRVAERYRALEHARSIVVAPLLAAGEVIGVLKVMSAGVAAFTEREAQNLQILAGSLGALLQRYRIADQLQRSEAQYRLMFENNPQPMWVYEAQGLRFLAVNRAAVLHYGWTQTEFLAMTVRDIWVPEENADLERQVRAIEPRAKLFGVRRRHRRKDGSSIDVEVSADGIVFDGQVARLVLASDVTDRLRAEREVARLVRAQRMLSACNEALIRAEAEPALLREICRITVEIGGYRMAHVGFAQRDEARSIVSVAQWGAAADYLRDVQISWDAGQTGGQSPSGRVIRSGEPVIIEDLALDPMFAPWLERARQSGFRGLVSLPLNDREGTFGVLALLAPEVARFGSDELRLLKELANDLAFGIGTLRAREDQRRVQSAMVKIATAVSAGSGGEFFEQLARNMAEALGAQGAFVSRLVGGARAQSARTLAVVVDGQVQDNFDHLSIGALWQRLAQEDGCVIVSLGDADDLCASGASEDPCGPAALRALDARTCAGLRLDNAAGQPVGLLAAIFREPVRQPAFIASTLQIFAARAAAEIERQESDARIRDQASLLDKAQDAILVYSMQDRIVYWNKSAERLYGWPADEMLGQDMVPRVFADRAAFAAAHAHVLRQGEWSGELAQRSRSGRDLVVEGRWTLVRDAEGQPQSILAINTDITERKAHELQIQRLAFYDALTGLPNRMLLMDRLQHALAASSRSGRGGALLFIDLDNFKTLNDTLGHDMGDLLLRRVADRLTSCVREYDTVARLGGDEFVVMLEDLGETAADVALLSRGVGEKILASLHQPYQLASYEHRSTASIGVAPFVERHVSVGELLKQADLAMYQAKSAGRNTLRFFDPGMQAVVSERAALEVDLRLALTQHEFVVHYQPQQDSGGRITGVEALVRWQHPVRGMVSPAQFIPLAEETGLILPLGRWVLESACAVLAQWNERDATAALTMAVNVSPRQFRHPDFVEQVIEVLERSGANPLNLKLELTESLLVDDIALTIEKMSALKALGVCFSLDDFGTGYSSLAYLKQLPLDQLKIDQSFVRDVLSDPNDAAIARTIIALGQSLGLDVIAEGVETAPQRDFLARHGCHAYQGYFLSRPLPLSQLGQFLDRARTGTL